MRIKLLILIISIGYSADQIGTTLTYSVNDGDIPIDCMSDSLYIYFNGIPLTIENGLGSVPYCIPEYNLFAVFIWGSTQESLVYQLITGGGELTFKLDPAYDDSDILYSMNESPMIVPSGYFLHDEDMTISFSQEELIDDVVTLVNIIMGE